MTAAAPRLSSATISHLPADVARPAYDRAAQRCGIVHLGIGAFHRVHQAAYTDDAMNAGGRDWGITGVSLRSADVAEQMNPQDGLYTVTERSADGARTRLIGAVQRVLVAPHERQAVVNALASPHTHIVSLTITEKGYCRSGDGALDPAQAGDGSIYPLLTVALRARMLGRLPGLTLLSCDNLANNGAQLHALMCTYLDRAAPDVRRWFERECTCPATMVDRIVPATTADDRARIAAHLGMADAAAVITEPFTQWVIEDRFAGPRPAWHHHGAQFTGDVHAFETAKLRMLNGAHSALAYLGLARGYSYVHQAVADPELRAFVDQLMRVEAAPSITPAPGLSLGGYADALLARFANPALNHRLMQIAMDGSQKIPQRWLETLAFHQRQGHDCPAILAAMGAWIRHLGGANGPVDDPMASALSIAVGAADPVTRAARLFGTGGLFSAHWVASSAALSAIANAA